jgi:hypothetical protein
MNDIPARLAEDLKAAMKAKDQTALVALRALKTALTNAAIEKGSVGTALDEAEVTAVIRRQVKQRRDSIEQFENAGRAELAAAELAEIAVLERYLPAALGPAELAALVAAAIAETGASSKADMGKVMKLVQERAAGRAEGKALSAEVMKQLG